MILKNIVFRMITRPAVMYGSVCWAEQKNEVRNSTMLRWARRKTRLDQISNDNFRKETHIKPVETITMNLKSPGDENERVGVMKGETS